MSPQKVGIAFVLLMLLAMPMVVGAVEEPKVYSREEILMYEEDSWDSHFFVEYPLPIIPDTHPRSFIFTPQKTIINSFDPVELVVDENLLFQGCIDVDLSKEVGGETKVLSGFVSGAPVEINIYKGGIRIFWDSVMTDDTGKFEHNSFVPREQGYYILVYEYLAGTTQYYEAQNGWLSSDDIVFYVSKEITPTPTLTPTPQAHGFGIAFAIVGLLSVAYLIRQRKFGD